MECNIALKLTLVLVLPCRSTQSMSGAQWLKPLRYFMAFGRFSFSSLHWNTKTSPRRRHVESCQCLAQAMTFDKQSLSIMNAPSLGTGRWVSYACENPSCPGKGAEHPFLSFSLSRPLNTSNFSSGTHQLQLLEDKESPGPS